MATPSVVHLSRCLSSSFATLHAATAISTWNAIAATENLLAAVGRERLWEESYAAPSASSASRHLHAPGGLLARCTRHALPLSSAGRACTAFGAGSSTRWPSLRSFASQAQSQPQPQSQGEAAAPHSQSPSPPLQQEQQRLPRPSNDVVYYGPLSQQHKLLKRISIANTLVAAAAAPAIVAFADNISLVSRYGLAASLVFFGLATTGALHWVANPYVHELKYDAATGTIDVRTTTLLGGSRWHSFNVDDVRPLPWNRPVATFTAQGRFYYIDVYSFPDEQLLRRLTPDEADVPKGYKDKEDDDDD